MSKERACKKCKTIFKGAKCPKCGAEEFTEGFKGKIVMLNPEGSEVAEKTGLKEKGEYAIRI
jgi:DNA-directed RNA polymerase subunit E"